MKEILKKIIVETWNSKIGYVQRNKVPLGLINANSSLVIVGPRRAGKSYTIYELINELSIKHKEKNLIYINFEDERLIQFKTNNFDDILEAYYELRQEKPFLFLDEIQNIDSWNKYVRRLADSGYKVIVTGSNSIMLSREIAEKLGGRFAQITIYPLDFSEFLKFNGLKINKESQYSSDRFLIKKYFNEYLNYGGFPEVSLISGDEGKKKLLESYFNLVFYKDLVTRKKLENEEVLKFIIKKIREGVGRVITPSAVYTALKNAGIEVGPNTVEKYINYLEEAFVIVACKPFAKSIIKQEKVKKYLIDNGYVKLFEVKEDRGLLLENLVFIEFVKKGKQVYFHQGKKECDFVVDGIWAIQVTYELNEENEAREIDGLLEAMEVYKIKKGIILTNDQEKEIIRNGIKIAVVPVWKWCIRN